jgi:hypothetical protein
VACVIGYRHADPRYPFLWESTEQPPARWHDEGEGPVHYLATTPDAAWAELLRHEEITDPADLETIRRAMWTVDVPHATLPEARLPLRVLRGDERSYAQCRREARRLREAGAPGLRARSAAVLSTTGSGHRVDDGLRPGPRRDEEVIVLFGRRPDLVGWAACAVGRPRDDLLPRVRHIRRPFRPAS